MATTVLKTVITAIGGGTASLLGGGKFANGAFSGAFVYLFNHNFSLKRIYKGLWKGMRGVYNKRGQILEDAGNGFKGYLNGYRDVRDNAPIGIRLWLRGTLTITEMGATAGLSGTTKIVYDMFSGAYSDTIITSEYGLSGYIIHGYYNDLIGVPYYKNNFNPYSF
jgi:hypothetical protein